jgi:hypothetical protein
MCEIPVLDPECRPLEEEDVESVPTELEIFLGQVLLNIAAGPSSMPPYYYSLKLSKVHLCFFGLLSCGPYELRQLLLTAISPSAAFSLAEQLIIQLNGGGSIGGCLSGAAG